MRKPRKLIEAVRPAKRTTRHYFCRLVELTHATASRNANLLRALKQAATTGEFQYEAIFYQSLIAERGVQRLRLCERYFNAGSLGIVKAGLEPYCCNLHSLVIRLWHRLVTEMYCTECFMRPARAGRLNRNPWRIMEHPQGFRDLILWQLDGVPLDEFPAGLHRELHAAEAAIGSQIFSDPDDRLAEAAFAHWSAVEVHCTLTALRVALDSLPRVGDLAEAEVSTGWIAFELPLLPVKMQDVGFYALATHGTYSGNWIIEAEKARTALDRTICRDLGDYHRILADVSRPWLEGLHENFPWPLPKPWDKDFATEWQFYAMNLRELPSLNVLEEEWREYVEELDAAGGSMLVVSNPAESSDGMDFDPSQIVTLDQMAAMVSRKKRTLEEWQQKDDEFPLPKVEGGGGRASLWVWAEIVDYLRKKAGIQMLPDRFPSVRS